MKDYIRRSPKFILYIVFIFFLILGVFPLIAQGKPLSESMNELLESSKFTIMFGLLIAYGFAYPLITFVNIKRHLNGSFEENRDKFERAFAALDYVLTEETREKIVFRKKSQFSRLVQWYEDEITLSILENPVIISGFRKWVMRLDKIIDQYIVKEKE